MAAARSSTSWKRSRRASRRRPPNPKTPSARRTPNSRRRSATADVTATCTNNGQKQAPGQNPADVTVSGGESIPEEEIQNGNLSFSVETDPPVTPIAGAPECPNPNWTEDITDLSFTSATITVEQPPGTLVLTVTCQFASPTANGPVPGGNVSCTQS